MWTLLLNFSQSAPVLQRSHYSLHTHADTQTRVTVRRTPMAPHTRLLSNNNDSDLLEISGVRGASGRGRRLSLAVYRHSDIQQADKTRHTFSTFGAQKKKEGGKKTLSTFLPLRKAAFSPPAPTVVPCRPPPSLPKRQQRRRLRSIGIQRLRYLRKQSLLNILTAVCSVSRGHVPYTGGLWIDKENCKFVLPATRAPRSCSES